jgi:hypothetical protein
LARERSAYEAWKSRDAKFWNAFLSDNFVGWGSAGKLNKASATTQYSGADCEIKSYAFSDEQVQLLGGNAGLITHRISVDGTCNGQKLPADSWVASVYVRDGDRWKAVFHAEDPIVDPKTAPTKPVDQKAPSMKADGTCYDQKIGPVWSTSIYVKHGNAWKWTFGINLPAPQ